MNVVPARLMAASKSSLRPACLLLFRSLNNKAITRSLRTPPKQLVVPSHHYHPQPITPHPSSILSQPASHRRRYSSQPDPDPTPYSFDDIKHLSSSPSPRRLIIDVREPAELQETGRIPGALSMPIMSNPDAFYLGDEDFLDRFGFQRPRSRSPSASREESSREVEQGNPKSRSPYSAEMKSREANAGLNPSGESPTDSEKVNRDAGYGSSSEDGDGVEEVVFYCKAGVRSRNAAKMAREWEGIRAGDMKGGWLEWEERGGDVERG